MTQSKINKLVGIANQLCITYAIGYVVLAHLMRFSSDYALRVEPNLMWVETFGPVWDLSPFAVLMIPFALATALSFFRKDEPVFGGVQD